MTVDTSGPGPSDDPAERVEDRARGRAEDRVQGQAEDRARGRAEGQARGQAEDRAQGQARDRVQGQAEDRAQDQTPDQAEDREPGTGAGLSERDRDVLAVERRGWPGPGAKERAIRERLGISPTRYYQLLNALLDDPRALEHDPVTVNRLRRIRDERRERR
ncbi:DUF3263 domain-containing protein [Streptomyces sp. 8ZJF_21]|uniref:DUF3263 domain-containing protein n=1 Tax=Streptomyces sp. 8ZJF_21 TaxID=2903141 RepID=UPI001E4F0339|nr:DUF3263 domain-containing protein [Streptomyces sp. 8ZJF_21]MCD9592718.1 DUF3263 domain-containing protein [Streptomyces sp. 8ZJF_21]